MKNFKIFKSGFGEKLKLLLIPIGLLIGSLTSQTWAKYVYVDKSNLTGYGTPYVHYWGGSGVADTKAAMTCVSGDLFKLNIPDNATTWQVCRYDNGNYYNYLGGSGMSLSDYDVCYIMGWDASYWGKFQTKTYDGTQKIYFKNKVPSGWGSTKWITGGLTGWIHLFNMSTGATADVKLTNISGDYYEGTPAAGTYSDVILVRCDNASSISWPSPRTDNRSLAFSVGDAACNMIDNFSPGTWSTNYGGWNKYGATAALVGDFNNWAPNSGMFGDWDSNKGKVYVNLTAGETYEFRILVGETYWGLNNASNITSSITSWWLLKSGEGNLSLTADETGEYVFQWNKSTNYFGVYYPKARLTANKVYYFDASGSSESVWNSANFSSMFYFRYYDSESNYDGGQVCTYANAIGSKAVGDGPVFYKAAPDNNFIGSVIIDRYNTAGDARWGTNSTQAAHGYNRSSSAENCFYITDANSWDPSVGWKTYCPPMTSASLNDNSTTTISWQTGSGTSEDPYLVPVTGTIKVSADATSKVEEDLNMTKKYDFKVNTGSGANSEQDGTGTTFDKSSLSNNTTYEISVEPYNYYNGTSGTKYTSATHKWYKALNMYSVTHTLSHVTRSAGRTDANAAAYHLAYTATYTDATGYDLPEHITVKFGSTTKTEGTDYTWNQGTGVLSIPVNKIDGNVTVIINGVEETYTSADNINKNGGSSHGQYTATYNNTTIAINIAPVNAGYDIEGYYTESTLNNKIATPNNNGTATLTKDFVRAETRYTDIDGKWVYLDAPTLYAKWSPKSYDITLHASLPGDATGSEGTDKITATMGTTTFSPNAASRTMPSENGYDFLGYFTNDVPNIQILYANGTKYEGTKYIDGDGNWSWADDIDAYGHWSAKTYTVSLDPENGSSATDITATFDATTNLSRIVKPSKTGYTFGGYYTAVAGGGTQLIDEDGDWIASVSGYTGDNGSGAATWKYYTNSTITLYAKWTQTIAFNQNSATVNGTTSLAATYHTTLSTGSIENPKRIGYAFAGWATAADGSVVIGTDGTVNSVDGYTDGSKNWVHAGESTLYAKWTADVKTFKGNGDEGHTTEWNHAKNWEGGVVPTDDYSEVHIERGVNIGEDEAYHVGKIVIEPNHTLTLINGGVLEVAGTITRPNDEPTETYEISLSSTGSKQSALIFDNTAGTTKASVSLWTSAKYNPSTSGYSFQYVAVPMTIVNVSDAFSGQNVYTYVWNEGSGWERRNYYYSLFGFEAVGVTSKDGLVAHTTGTLVSTANIVNRPLAYTSGDDNKVGMNMIGNSWTAPIKISEMEITGNAESTVYVYNSSTGSWVGNPTAVSGDAIVPAMQAYLIKATSGGGSLSIDYDKAVRGVAASDRTAPLFAPKRDASSAGISEIRMRVSDDEDFYSVLRLFENEQFTDEFDNGWEARYIAGEGFAGQLYAQTDDKMTVLATPNLEGQVVGFVPGMATNYTISFAGDGMGYYLNDLDEQESTLIAEGNTYMFTPNESTNATRFVISKMPIHKTTTGNDAIYDGVKARKQMIDGILYIIRDGRIYDATGALVK